MPPIKDSGMVTSTVSPFSAVGYSGLSIRSGTPGQVAGSFGLEPSGMSLTLRPPAQALSSFSTTQCGCQTERFFLP